MNKETLVSFLDYFPPDAPFFLDEPDRLMETANAVSQEFRESMTNRLEKGYVTAEELPALFTPEQVTAILTRPRTVLMTGLEQKGGSIRPAWRFFLAAQTVNSYQNSFEMLIADLKKWKRDKARVVLLAGSRTRAERLAHDLQEYELASFYTGEEDQEVQPGQVLVTYGNIHKGFAYPAIRFYILSEGDLFGKEKKKRRKKTNLRGETYPGVLAAFGRGLCYSRESWPGHLSGHQPHDSRRCREGLHEDHIWRWGQSLYPGHADEPGSEVCWSGCREGSEAEPPGRRRSGIRRRRG